MKHIFWILFFYSFSVFAGNFPSKPLNYVTDEANVIDEADEALLNKKLHAFQDSTSTQIFVYVASSLNGADMTLLSQEIFGAWDIGQKGKNNGVLIAVFINDHKFRIHTGYGMEGVLPDVLTKRIQDEDMRPLFKENNYYEGINAGVDKLIYYSKHEYKPEEEDLTTGFVIFYVLSAISYLLFFLLLRSKYIENKKAKRNLRIIMAIVMLIPVFGFFIMVIVLFITGLIILIKKASAGGSSWSSGSSGTTFYSGSSWSSSSDSDSSWSSSSSDSDFGGGGGGDSGGGGSSSDW